MVLLDRETFLTKSRRDIYYSFRLIIQYKSLIWWPFGEFGWVFRKLAYIQRLSILGITDSMRTTHTAAPDILLGLQ